MVRKFPPFRSERKKRSTSEGTPQFPNGISGKLLYHLTSNRNFPIFLPNGKHPWSPAKVFTLDHGIKMNVREAINFSLNKLNFEDIIENQSKVVEAYLSGRDVLMTSPTGSGKSLTFHIAPFAIDFFKHGELRKRWYPDSVSRNFSSGFVKAN